MPRRFADTCDTMLVPRTARVCSQWKADLGNVRRADFLGGSSTWCVSRQRILLEATTRQGHPTDAPTGQKQGGQQLIGGLDVTVSRNYFGSQVDSFETQLPAPPCLRSIAECVIVAHTVIARIL